MTTRSVDPPDDGAAPLEEFGAKDDAPSAFVEHVLEVVRSIPSGRVMTYGDVAATLGSRGARAVGTVMARHGSAVTWWRVIPASGQPPRGHEERAWQHYLEEGTPLHAGKEEYRVDLTRARYRPS